MLSNNIGNVKATISSILSKNIGNVKARISAMLKQQYLQYCGTILAIISNNHLATVMMADPSGVHTLSPATRLI